MAKGDTTFGTPVFAKPEWGGLKKTYGKVTLVGNYETGGYDFLLDTILNLGDVLFVGLPPTVIGHVPEYNPTTGKLLFYVQDTDGGPLVQLADDNAALINKIISFEVIHRGV